MIPEKISIQGCDWEVQVVAELFDELGRPCYGICDCETKTIRIRKDTNKLRLQQTLIHEAFHALCFQSGLHQTYDYNVNYEEIIAEQLANFLTSSQLKLTFKRGGDPASKGGKQ